MASQWFSNHSHVSQTIFIVIILYAISSLVVLGMAWGIYPFLPQEFYLNPSMCIAYAMISFALTAFISAYHLSTFIRRRKRKIDLNGDSGKAA